MLWLAYTLKPHSQKSYSEDTSLQSIGHTYRISGFTCVVHLATTAIAICRKHIDNFVEECEYSKDDNDDNNNNSKSTFNKPSDQQAGHSTRTSNAIYAVSIDISRDLTEDAVRQFEAISVKWHVLFGLVDAPTSSNSRGKRRRQDSPDANVQRKRAAIAFDNGKCLLTKWLNVMMLIMIMIIEQTASHQADPEPIASQLVDPVETDLVHVNHVDWNRDLSDYHNGKYLLV